MISLMQSSSPSFLWISLDFSLYLFGSLDAKRLPTICVTGFHYTGYSNGLSRPDLKRESQTNWKKTLNQCNLRTFKKKLKRWNSSLNKQGHSAWVEKKLMTKESIHFLLKIKMLRSFRKSWKNFRKSIKIVWKMMSLKAKITKRASRSLMIIWKEL